MIQVLLGREKQGRITVHHACCVKEALVNENLRLLVILPTSIMWKPVGNNTDI